MIPWDLHGTLMGLPLGVDLLGAFVILRWLPCNLHLTSVGVRSDLSLLVGPSYGVLGALTRLSCSREHHETPMGRVFPWQPRGSLVVFFVGFTLDFHETSLDVHGTTITAHPWDSMGRSWARGGLICPMGPSWDSNCTSMGRGLLYDFRGAVMLP